MSDSQGQMEFLLQTEWRKNIEEIGVHQWLPVYRQIDNDDETVGFFCGLIPNEKVEESLSDPTWDLSIGGGVPGCSVSYEGDTETVTYHRFGGDTGVEPFIIRRSFSGGKPSSCEIIEEFRMFHNLFYDSESNVYTKLNDAGEDEIIVKIEPDSIQLRQKELRQFLSMKEMQLGIFFDIIHFSELNPSVAPTEQREIHHQANMLRYEFYISHDFSERKVSLSRFYGKKLITPYPKRSCGIWPYEDPEEFEDFIIGVDADSEPISYSCNDANLANNFGANPDAPHYLTMVFFSQNVLEKYYIDSKRYTVGDNHLSCDGLWSLRMDNNHSEHVIVFLGDLGRDIPHKEQVYWKSFNIPPQGELSSVSQKRYWKGLFTDPERADLLFKYTFETFQGEWTEKFGWPLFLPLGERDQHLFSGLRIPLTNDQAAFDTQVLAIAKILIDSLNEKAIERELGNNEPGLKGISKFEAYVKQESLPNFEPLIGFLRDLWDLRSTGSGHRKGKKYLKVAHVFGIGVKDFNLIFEEILTDANKLLNVLKDHFLH